MAPNIKSILDPNSGVQGKYVVEPERLNALIKVLKEEDYKICLTQGVYDMFHPGHGRYLRAAAEFGDILIVGVDSDELTREMKGPTRPFDSFNERAEMLSMLGFVNIIVKRDVGQDKYDLIKLVQPDVLVMSKTTKTFGDEDIAALSSFCGKIEHLEPQASTSTTAKMRRMKVEGVKEYADFLAMITNDYMVEGPLYQLIEQHLNQKGATNGKPDGVHSGAESEVSRVVQASSAG